LAELAPFALWLAVVIITAWLFYEHQSLAHARARIDREAVDNAERHIEVIALADAMDRRVREHTHHLDYAGRLHDHPHDHPHQHEHVQHVHTLIKLSEHENAGTKVVVKKCEDCETIFRDRKALANGRPE